MTQVLFNLSTLRVADVAAVHLTGVNGELLFADPQTRLLPLEMGLFSPGSDEYAAAEEARTDRVVERNANSGSKPMNAKELRNEQMQFLIDCTAYAKNLTYDGDPTGKDLYRAIYSDRKIGYIYDKMNRKLTEWATFTTGSANS